MSNVSPRRALTQAIHNDRNGVVSRRDAERIVDAGLSTISESDDPNAALQNAQRYVNASQALVGRDQNATNTLQSFRNRGQEAVRERLAELTGSPQLPRGALASFDQLLADYGALEVDGPATFTNVSGNDKDGYTFDWAAGNKSGKAHAIPYEGNWLVAEKAIPKAVMDAAVTAMRDHFDAYFAPDLLQSGETRAALGSMRDAITIASVMWSGEEDPVGAYQSDYAFTMENPTGSDHGFYVGVESDLSAFADSFN